MAGPVPAIHVEGLTSTASRGGCPEQVRAWRFY